MTGYGECVPWSAPSQDESFFAVGVSEYAAAHPNRLGDYGYRCLCNECFDEVVQDNGQRTCVRNPDCQPKDYCEPNPCKCGGVCETCPECAAKGEPGYYNIFSDSELERFEF